MIVHNKQCIFIEVPKTGSTSIRTILGHPKKPHLNVMEIKEEFINDGLNRASPSNIFERFWIKQQLLKQFDSYYKFGFVRNPWDRVVSLYNRKQGVQMAKTMSFEEFVGWIRHSSDTSIHSSELTNQLDWFIDGKGEVIVNHIGRFENIENEWKNICEQIDVDIDLPHKNKNTGREHYSHYYNKQTQDIIAQKFRGDIDYFNYEYEQQ